MSGGFDFAWDCTDLEVTAKVTLQGPLQNTKQALDLEMLDTQT